MVTEKVLAAGTAAVTLATGGNPHKVVRGYRKKVWANHRRLANGEFPSHHTARMPSTCY